MNKKILLSIAGIAVLLIGAFAAGVMFSRSAASSAQGGSSAGVMGSDEADMMAVNGGPDASGRPEGMGGEGYGPGAMMGNEYGSGMSGEGYGSGTMMDGEYGYGMSGEGYGPGAMMGGGYGYGMMGGYDPGAMMGGEYDPNAEPLSIEQVRQAIEAYLSAWNNPDLEIGEIMIFDNQAYAEILEKSTGIGAMEVLVDPATRTVYPEYGPNMMWNQKYGQMGGSYGMMGGYRGGMMGYAPTPDISAEMSISPDEALRLAQQFLDENFPGLQAASEADPFYGYYTIHTYKDGQVVGMLSVNGYNGEVFPHIWHGNFIEMSGERG